MRLLIMFLMGLCFASYSAAQVPNQEAQIQHLKFYMDSLDYQVHQSTRLTLESNFMNRVLYSGRDYGLKGFGTSSQLTFTHKSGFWLSTVGYYWQGSSIKFPKADVQIGYARTLDERVSASVSYSRWSYFGRSRDELRWTFDNFISTYWTINTGFIGISPSFYYMTSPSENVAQFALTASKYFEIKKPVLGGKIILEPNITWMTSTRDKYDIYEPTRREGKLLRVIDYEMVIPIIYRKVGYFDFVAKTHLTYPLNIDPNDGAEEKLITFFSADLKILLWRGKAAEKRKSLL
jgi:hypothetical protein